jgi:hypothetical protein
MIPPVLGSSRAVNEGDGKAKKKAKKNNKNTKN